MVEENNETNTDNKIVDFCVADNYSPVVVNVENDVLPGPSLAKKKKVIGNAATMSDGENSDDDDNYYNNRNVLHDKWRTNVSVVRGAKRVRVRGGGKRNILGHGNKILSDKHDTIIQNTGATTRVGRPKGRKSP